MRHTILTLDRWLTSLAWTLACLLLAATTCHMPRAEMARFVLSQPSTWTEESMRRLLIWMVMLGTVVAFRRGALVSVDLMVRTAKGIWLKVVRTVITTTALAYLAVLVWYGINLVTVLFNNEAYGNVLRDQRRLFDGRDAGSKLTNPDFAAWARVFGAEGITISTEAEVEAGIARAFAMKTKPVVVHVHTSAEQIGARRRRGAPRVHG